MKGYDAGKMRMAAAFMAALLASACFFCFFCFVGCPVAARAEAARYQGRATTTLSIRAEPSQESPRLSYYEQGELVDIISYDLEWLYVQKGETTGYVLRQYVEVERKTDPNAPAYGVLNIRHTATLIGDAPLYAKPTTQSATLANLPKGAMVAIISITDGWAKLLFNRQYGYLYAANITAFEPVAKDPLSAKPGSIISAFQTAYNLAGTELNMGRMANIKVACDYMQGQTIKPNASLSFNAWIGPFSARRGYENAPILINGTTMPGSGGGTCQVSTTLYNTLLELNGVTILHRRAHGPSGAVYVPHGVDAAVGNGSLDLVFRNDYDFDLVFSTWVGNGVLFIAIYKEFIPS